MSENKSNIVAEIKVFEDNKGGRRAIPEFRVGATGLTPGRGTDAVIKPIPSEIPIYEVTGYDWANHGIYDDYPNMLEGKVKKVATLGQVILQNVLSLIGDNLVYCPVNQKRLPQNEREVTYNQEVEDFLDDNDILETMHAAAFAFLLHAQFFPIYTLNGNRDKIARIEILPVPFLRKAKQNPQSLRSEFLLHSEYFGGKYGIPNKDQIVKIPLKENLDASFFDRLQGYRFASHVYLPFTAFHYYATAPWAGLFEENNWIDIAAKVPAGISAMQDNLMQAACIIKIEEAYFQLRYMGNESPEDNWETMSSQRQLSIIKAKIKEIEDNLTNPKNKGKSISYVYQYDPMTARESGHIHIEFLDNKVKAGDWLPDIGEANNQIVQGMGGNASIYGLQPQGGKMGAGSGSDKMQARNIQISTNTIIQEFVLSWINYISKFNKWGVHFYFRDMTLTTKDKSNGGF